MQMNWVRPSENQRFCKMTLTRVSSHWLWLESFCEKRDSSHDYSQCNSSRVRATKNRDSSHATTGENCVLKSSIQKKRLVQTTNKVCQIPARKNAASLWLIKHSEHDPPPCEIIITMLCVVWLNPMLSSALCDSFFLSTQPAYSHLSV